MMRDYKSGLEDWLDATTCGRFLTQINVSLQVPSLGYLTELVRACYASIPFQNLAMLTRPRVPPTREEIIGDMLTGLGGLCETHNFFFCAVLQQLGFQAGLLSASMQEPDCHVGLMVEIEAQAYWLDLGNGWPYLTPLPIAHGATAKHLEFEYGLELQNDMFRLKQSSITNTGKKSYDQCFAPNPVHCSHFDGMRKQHYCNPDFGPFLNGIRVNRWELDRGFLMRNDSLWTLPGKSSLNNNEATCINWLQQNFTNTELVPLYRESRKILNDKAND